MLIVKWKALLGTNPLPWLFVDETKPFGTEGGPDNPRRSQVYEKGRISMKKGERDQPAFLESHR